jgi:hypothetical protein
MNAEREIRDLKRRVAAFECSFAGAAVHISALHKDLLAFLARIEQRFDRVLGRHGQVPGRFDRIDGKFDGIERELRGLRADMPKIVRRALREALGAPARRKP